jgi:hypothetical protein
MATDDHMTVTAVGLPEGATSMSFGKFELENGQSIENVILGYTTYGTLNAVRPIFTRPPGRPREFNPRALFPLLRSDGHARIRASPATRPLIPLLLRPLFSGWR